MMAMRAGIFRQRLFVRGIEKPLALQLRLELLEGDVQVARCPPAIARRP